MLPPKLPKRPKRESRWRSAAHCNFVRGHACSDCGATAGIEVAHVRLGSGAGMGQKPDDWRTVSLCRDCHQHQHSAGEDTYWTLYRCTYGKTVDELIQAFCDASPKAADIRRAKAERANG
jgi:hypothetical protein